MVMRRRGRGVGYGSFTAPGAAMNDPHVEALHYKITHGPTVDYNRAPSIVHDEPNFTVQVAKGRAEITLKSHHATVEAARAEVEAVLRAWELSATLECGPDQFKFD